MSFFVETWRRFQRLQTIKFLCSARPERIEAFGKKSLLKAFQRTATKVPAYQDILKMNNVDWRIVRDLASFKKLVPVIDKHATFASHEIEDLCAGGTFKDMKLALASSGFSGLFSFGINTPRNYRDTARSIDTAMDYVFDISRKKTFLVNCIPMGVKVTTSLKLCETSVRPDMALAIIKKFSPKFDQTLIVSDPHFLKKLIEDGLKQGINWKRINVSLIFGEDWFSESFRSYMAHLLDINFNNPDGRLIGATMGIAELDLNLFHESLHTILIRRKAQDDASLREALFGPNTKVCPELYHYYPHRIFLEALPADSKDKELIFSMLSPHMLIPLLRYNSKDRGDIIPYNKLKSILREHNLLKLLPPLKLPLVWVGGRNDRFLEIQGQHIYPEEVKQGLYEDFEAAAQTTGYIRLNREKKILEVQLKEGIDNTTGTLDRFKKACLKYTDADLPVKLYPYREFPYSMELSYEKKFQYI